MVYHSGYGRTERLAQAVAIDATVMGSVGWQFKKFADLPLSPRRPLRCRP
ncbi:hypothetical protein GALL_269030 [mine drainage metagenome]|uniref:Uncharacterized protein n=1 Tax=mine drainage metagenome TaxID=410659 RepID=A0A1J5RSX8_9ZZZZ